MRLLLALLPAATWAATIYQYDVQVTAAQWGELQFEPWSMTFAAPLPVDERVVVTDALLTGSPYSGAAFTAIWLQNYPDHHDSSFRVFFDSSLGQLMYEAWGYILAPGPRPLLGHVVGPTFEPRFEGSLSIHTPEPSSLILITSALLWGGYRAHLRRGRGYSNRSLSSSQ